MTDPQSNLPYAIQQSITTVGDQSIEFTAPASGTLEGGAFNILDQILNANDFLRDKTSAATGCGTTFTDCQPFTVAPLVQIFWRRGYSPAPYVGGSAASSISFYMMGKSQLYIQGGINGDVDNSDTDHFDNPVILHEYGHFLEDQFGKSDSPGGSHNGSSQVDSRLAWSEGWADFIQAAVRSQGDYYDSIGTSEGTAGFAIPPEPLTTAGRTLDIPQNSVVPADGEGTFREFSIARVLWLATDPSGQVQSPFSELWSLFSGANGFRSPNVHFRSISVFNQMHTSRAAPYKDWSTVTTGEHQSLDRSTYATPIQVGGSCGKSAVAKIQPTATYVANYYPTDFLRNNRFYEFDHAGGAVDITLSYNTPSGKLADLDLAIYPEQFVYQQDQILQSASTPPTNCSGGALCAERVVGTLSAGHYLINVTEFFDANSTNSDPGATQFTLTINSQPVCFGP